MSTIPLPALDVRPPAQQPGPLQIYGQMMGIKNAQQEMAQRQAMAPLQQQDAQLDVQQRQQQLTNQKALTAAYQNWDGKDYMDLAHGALNNGASGDVVQGIMQHALTVKKTVSDIAAQDATTGSKNLETVKQQNDMVSGAIGNVLNAPDGQMPQKLLDTVNELAQQKRYDGTPLLDQQHMQLAQQLAQAGPQAIRQALPMFQKDFMAASQQIDAAAKNATTQKTQTDNQVEQQVLQSGGNQQLADAKYRTLLAAQNQGQAPAPADAAWMKAYKEQKEIVPAFTFNQNVAGTSGAGAQPGFQQSGGGTDWGKVAQHYGMTPGAFDQTAEKYFQTGQLPPIGRSANAIAMNRDLMSRAGELHPSESLAESSAAFKANADSLKKLQTNFDQVQAFEQTAEKNMDLLQAIAQKIPDLGARFANVPARMISANMIGTDNMAAFKTALTTAQTEAAKVLNSANASGMLSDSARHELQDVIDANLPLSAMVASLGTLKQDMGNRTQAYQSQIGDIQKRIKGSSSAQPGGGAQPGVVQANRSGADPFTQFGGVAH